MNSSIFQCLARAWYVGVFRLGDNVVFLPGLCIGVIGVVLGVVGALHRILHLLIGILNLLRRAVGPGALARAGRLAGCLLARLT